MKNVTITQTAKDKLRNKWHYVANKTEIMQYVL